MAIYFNHHIKETPVKYEIIHTLMSFGSGIMLSVIALVLIPKGMEELELVPIVISFLAGTLFGHFVFSDYPKVTANLMVFASGGILYLLIQDIIPESKLKNNYLTPLGATLGFLIGIIGEKLI